jgi:hypothetical protein
LSLAIAETLSLEPGFGSWTAIYRLSFEDYLKGTVS